MKNQPLDYLKFDTKKSTATQLMVLFFSAVFINIVLFSVIESMRIFLPPHLLDLGDGIQLSTIGTLNLSVYLLTSIFIPTILNKVIPVLNSILISLYTASLMAVAESGFIVFSYFVVPKQSFSLFSVSDLIRVLTIVTLVTVKK